MKSLSKQGMFVLALLVSAGPSALAQVKEQVEEIKPKKMAIDTALTRTRDFNNHKRDHLLDSYIQLSGGYDTNPRLTSIRKGDSSGDLRYTLFYKQRLKHEFYLNFNYNVDITGYSKFKELSNLLNDVVLSVDKVINKYFGFGAGYDYSDFFYPSGKLSDYYFHKGFIYLRNTITKNFYHQLTLEYGYKVYTNQKALAYTIDTYQDMYRHDYRQAVNYTIGAQWAQKVFVNFHTKFSINDSNALFENYYDYKSWEFSPFVNYLINDKFSVYLTVTDKAWYYKSRQVSNQSLTRWDNTLTVSTGLRYKLNPKNTLMLDYSYNDNVSDDQTAEYLGHTFTAGWQHRF